MAKIIAMILLATLTLTAEAQMSSNTPPEDLPLIPEDAKLLKESLLWQYTLSLRTGAGYRDNVLLSPSDPQGSAFVTGGLDYSLSRVPLDGWGVDAIFSGDDERYLQNVPSDGTDFWLTDITFKRFLGDNWETGIESTENYLDEVDFVDTITGPEAVEIQGNILKLKPFVRRNLGTNWWAQLDFPAAREILDAPLDNIWKYGPQLELGFSDDKKTEVTVSYEIQQFDHDTWPALTADGATIGTRNLSVVEQRAELDWRQFWGAENHWSTDTKLGFTMDEDNGGKFFNFNEYSVAERLRYEMGNWQFTATLRGSYLDYPVQRTDLIDGPTLNEILLHATLRGERRLKKWLKLYAEYNYERVLSNLPDIRYQANTITAGLIWEF